jgi:hypothetical protein
MAKVYGGEDSSKFVNGVLGKIAEVRGVEAPEQADLTGESAAADEPERD